MLYRLKNTGLFPKILKLILRKVKGCDHVLPLTVDHPFFKFTCEV